ncbi:amino acid adenylation domain protein [Chondrocystis sp. NIES-4102]|nr:amino acid adenylation domain protein [Chondrocystis sp. NIES-4102]
MRLCVKQNMNKKNIENIYPLTPMQQGILFHTLNAPDRGLYIIQSSYKLKNLINITAFKEAWQKVIDHNPILRTSFHWQQYQEPFQVVYKQVQLPWQEIQLKQGETLATWLEKDRQAGFNLNQAPLIRLSLIYLDNNTYQFIWSCHHLILDGWSTALILKQLLDSYQAIITDKPISLTPTRPYGDYVAWLRAQETSAAKTYWQTTLQGFTKPTPLQEGKWETKNTDKQGEKSLKISKETTQIIKAWARSHNLTVNTLIRGAWALLLSRYSGEDDIVFGATSSGRPPNLVGSSAMVGLFINTLPVRVKVDADQSLIGWLQTLQSQQSQAQQYEYTPLIQVQQWSDLSGDLPLFNSILVFENYPVDASIAEFGLAMEITETQSIESTHYPLTISAGLSEELFLEILYDRSLFSDSIIDLILGNLQHILEQFCTSPQASLKDLSLLRIDGQSNQVDYPDFCIHQLFEQQAAKTPDAVAVVFQQAQLTYQQLNQRAQELASYLQCLGVKPDVIVGIYLERSIEVIVAILAILKAGGAYLPLDPTYPQASLDYLLEDAQIAIILTTSSLKSCLTSKEIICLDQPQRSLSIPNQLSTPTPKNLAYIIYTSGSTGKPKGVAIAHSSLVNFATAATSVYGIKPQDVILQFASLSFDASIEEIFPILITGGTLVLRTPDMGYSPSKLLQKCDRYGITILDLPTAFWHLLVDELAKTPELELPQLIRLVIIGGEVVNPKQVVIWNQLVGDSCQLINTYGPTETTVVATSYLVPPQLDNLSSIPIGKPLPNVETYILDRFLQPVPLGVAGDLYIGGAGLARGYLNHDDFIDHLYKTGDKARYLPCGNLEFLGREDNQVKIRGFRVELTEITKRLQEHPAVKQAVVVFRNEESKLIAYLVVKDRDEHQAIKFRSYLKKQLPEYAIPSAFIFLDVFPLTVNGKIDYHNLPTAKIVNSEIKPNYVAPRTAMEIQIAKIWQEVLGVDNVGIYDNFFELGGHSLLIVNLFTRMGMDVPFQYLFDAPILIDFVAKLTETLPERNRGLDLNQEAVLDSDICLGDSKYGDKTNNILLTGATGFLGSFLLAELLQQTSGDIYCLVRAKNEELGKEKIKRSLCSYSLWQDSYSERIIAVVGDLSQPYLGLSGIKYQSLAKSIDLIYHNGAWVHHAMPYSSLKATNVLGTKEILRLAVSYRIKPVHFISTISVFSGVNNSHSQIVTETSKIDNFTAPAGGYVQSKWVADKLVSLASDRGIPVTIYRPGGISGDSQTGVFNPNDFLYRLLIGCIELGAIIEGDVLDSLIPVDYISRAIVSLSLQPASLGKVFHLVNSQRLDFKILISLIRGFGYQIEAVNQQQWQAKLGAIAQNMPEHPLYPLISLLDSSTDEQATISLKYDTQATLKALAKIGIACPSLDAKLLHTYLSYLHHNGWLKQPRKVSI